MSLVSSARRLGREVAKLSFGAPVTHVYNPLDYAWKPHRLYLELYGSSPKEVVLLGMNPGPWGMAQTGVPFGEVALVRDWLGIETQVARPAKEHPKRPVDGFCCSRSEVSGRRLWGWARDRFGTPEAFFQRFFIANYCPLSFMEESGRNRTPDRLPESEREPLLEICDQALAETVRALEPKLVVGVGKWAERRARRALAGLDLRIGSILHPSPASPLANRGWAKRAERDFEDLGVRL
ncbi:MAG: single-strand selective monofunctional uracil-DNA glycosylase [bacterium]|nr:single-strand selective monofunctional uracil-DNA glycosylase [bacterium]